jgi:eukaryotic sulfide quinone oxidoreductase
MMQAAQSGVLVWNLLAALKAQEGGAVYNGYTSCPLITGKNKLILAEFDYGLKPLETFPVDQAVERSSMYWLTADVIPYIYKSMMVKGSWTGPGIYRKFLNPMS